MNESEREVCATIVAAPEAWSERAAVEAEHGAERVAAAVEAGLLAVWCRPDYCALTLTPWAAERMGVEVDEVWRRGRELSEEFDEERPVKPAVSHLLSTLVEMPVWHWRQPRAVRRPVVLPAHGRIGTSLVRADRVAEPPAEPAPKRRRFVLTDDGEPLRLFPVRAGMAVEGLPVAIDRRIRG